MMDATRFLLSLFLFCLALLDCSALVPLIGWSNSDAFSPVKGNQFSGVSEFIYDAKLDNVDMIVIFKSPELSFDALTKYGGVYGGASALASMQSEMQSSKSSVWAGVEGNVASDLVSTLSFILNVQPRVIAGSDGVVKSKLLVVELTSNPVDWEGLSDQDYIISDVMAAIHSLPGSPSFAAMYTSSHTYLQHPEQQEHWVLKRSAGPVLKYRIPRQADSNSDFEPLCGLVITNNSDTGTPCLLFCLTSKNISRGNASEDQLPIEDRMPMEKLNVTDIDIINGSCIIGEEAYITIRANITDELPLDFLFTFPRGSCSGDGSQGTTSALECGFWTMEVYLDGQRLVRATEEHRIFPQFHIPVGTAYACGDNSLNVFRPPINSSESDAPQSDYQYRFYGIQAQAYGGIFNNSGVTPLRPPSFGSVFNCQSYLTIVPLMGLVTAVILLLILYCSVVFVFSIQTMDRFDDPRGPTISVENLH